MKDSKFEAPVKRLRILLIKNDFLQWLMDSAEGIENDADKLGDRILLMNVAAIFATSMVERLRMP